MASTHPVADCTVEDEDAAVERDSGHSEER